MPLRLGEDVDGEPASGEDRKTTERPSPGCSRGFGVEIEVAEDKGDEFHESSPWVG